MLEADGTTFRFYGLVPATGTINFPAVDVRPFPRTIVCQGVEEEAFLSIPFFSFSREGDRHASMVFDVWSGYVAWS